MAKDKSPEEIVDEVERELAFSRPCPYCRLYDGTHQVTCTYLLHKGNVDAARNVSSKTSKSAVDEGSSEQEKGKEEAPEKGIDPSAAKLLEQMKPKK